MAKLKDIINGAKRIGSGIVSSIYNGSDFALKALRANYEHITFFSLESNPPDRKKLSSDNPIGYFFASMVTYPIVALFGWVVVPAIVYFTQGLLYNARAGLNFILSEEQQITLGGKYEELGLNRYTFYSVLTGGFILGLPLAVGLAGLATVYRLIADAPRMAGRAYRSATNLAWYEPYKFESGTKDTELFTEHDNDALPGGAHFYWGILGTVIGGTAGLIVATFIWTGHGLQHTGAMFKRTIYSISNWVLHADENLTQAKGYELYGHQDVAPYEGRQYYGVIGSFAGLFTGIFIALPLISVGRLITNSATMTARAYRSATNLAWYDKYVYDSSKTDSPELLLDNSDDADHQARKYWGFLGLFIGGTAGLIAATFIWTGHGLQHTGAMFKRTIYSVSNWVLHADENLTQAKGYELYSHQDVAPYEGRQYYGVIGSFAGLFTGIFIALPLISVGRLITNSATMTARAYRSATNLAWYDKYVYDSSKTDSPELLLDNSDDADHQARKYWGFLGLFIGGTAGLIAATFIWTGHGLQHTGAMFKRTIYSVSNWVLHADENLTQAKGYELYSHQDVAPYEGRQYYGVIGSFAGLLTGIFIAVPLISVSRFVTNSATMTARAYRSATNLAWYNKYEYDKAKTDSPELLLDNSDDANHQARKYWGFLGVFIGGTAGLIAATFIWTGHGLQHTGAMFKRTIYSISNWVLHADENLTQAKGYELYSHQDVAPYEGRQYYGVIGSFAGLLTGIFIAVPLISVARFVTNSATMTARAYRSATNLAWYKKYEYDKAKTDSPELLLDNSDDANHQARKYWGFLGVFIGGTAGLIAATFIWTGHGLEHTGVMAKRTFYSVSNWLLHSTDTFKETDGYKLYNHDKDPPEHKGRKGYGVLGSLVGFVTGLFIVLPVIFVGRVLINTTVMGMRVYRQMANYALHKPYTFNKADPTDQNSYELFSENHDTDQSRFAWGILGWVIIGPVAGVIALGAIWTTHGLEHTGAMMKRSFYTALNLTLHKDQVFTAAAGYELFDHNDGDPEKYKHRQRLGIIGIIIGGGVALILGFVFIAPYRVLGNAFIAWKDYSGAYLNMAMEFEYFKTIPEDIAEQNYQSSGIPGKVGTYMGAFIATFTTGIVALGIYIVKEVPFIFLAAVGFVITPVVGAGKLVSKGISNYLVSDIRKKNILTQKPLEKNLFTAIKKPPRFPHLDSATEALINQDQVEENFKRLYSGLDFAGRFEEGLEITHATVKDGAKPFVRYMVKAATWDAKSLTEVTLDNLLVGYRKFHDRVPGGTAKEYQASQEYKDALDKAKQYYELSYPSYATPAAKKQRDLEFIEIEAVSEKVIRFLTEEDKSFKIEANFYKKYEMPMLTSYFEKGKAEKRQQHNAVLEQEHQEYAARYKAVTI